MVNALIYFQKNKIEPNNLTPQLIFLYKDDFKLIDTSLLPSETISYIDFNKEKLSNFMLSPEGMKCLQKRDFDF